MGQIGPYGTNEGDAWLAEGSAVQKRLDTEGKGQYVVHEIIDGEDRIYVTDDPNIIDRARAGTNLLGDEKMLVGTSGRIPLDKIVFPGLWPKGSEEIVRGWLLTEYDPNVMPPLIVNFRDGEYQLLGWEPDPDFHNGIGLLEIARGYGLTPEEEFYAREIWHRVEEGSLVLCPRCQIDHYVPYGTEGELPERFFPPALSRMDNKTYICSDCGRDEAMRDFQRLTPIPPDEWPMTRIPGFGLGQNVPKGGIEWTDQDQ